MLESSKRLKKQGKNKSELEVATFVENGNEASLGVGGYRTCFGSFAHVDHCLDHPVEA